MCFGQYSSMARPRMSKRDMVAGAQQRHPDGTVIDAIKTDNNTLCYRIAETGEKFWSFFDTDIVRLYAGGMRIEVSTGGYNTLTTQARLSGILHALGAGGVHTNKGVIHFRWRVGDDDYLTVPFNERLWIDLEKRSVRTDTTPREIGRVTALIDAYMRAWRERGLPPDSRGDPWVFLPPSGAPQVGPETMMDWVGGRYVFRNLYAYALLHAGVRREAVACFLADADRWGLGKTDLRRIRRYVRHNLGRN